MSTSLLINPDKVHDILDDLESIFWVLVYCALRHFSTPGLRMPMSIFDDEGVDEEGRRTGGMLKSACLSCRQLFDYKFSCIALERLIQEASDAWATYRIAIRGRIQASDVIQMLELAPVPSYWIKMFTDALQEQSHSSCKHTNNSMDSLARSLAGSAAEQGCAPPRNTEHTLNSRPSVYINSPQGPRAGEAAGTKLTARTASKRKIHEIGAVDEHNWPFPRRSARLKLARD